MASAKFHNSFRQYHRWLGFFLAGIMAVYCKRLVKAVLSILTWHGTIISLIMNRGHYAPPTPNKR